MYLVTPGGGLGAAAVEAAGTPEQKEKFLARFRGEKPVFGAMAMTEPQARLGHFRHPRHRRAG